MRRLCCLLAVPVVAASCGGSGDKGAQASGPRLTEKQFVTAANNVCIRSDRRIYRLGRLSRDPAGWAATAKAARIGVAEMQDLNPPASMEAGFRHLVRLGERLANGIQRTHDALAKQRYTAALAAQTAATNADSAIHRQAQKLGLTFCQQLLTNWPA